MSDPAIYALKRLCEREGGYKAVGLTLEVNPQTVYQIITDRVTSSGRKRGVGRKLRERLEEHYPGWMHLGVVSEPPVAYGDTGQTITPADSGQSQHVRPLIRSMSPPKIGWEALMECDDLPREFETELPDSAMSPEAPRGTRCIFLVGVQPEPGDWVLLRDSSGNVHCREFRLVRPGHWEAHAINRAFLPMYSDKESLVVIAVFDGMRGRRSTR